MWTNINIASTLIFPQQNNCAIKLYHSFDHYALKSLNNCRFVFLDSSTDTLGILGLVIYNWKSFWKYLFQWYITRLKTFNFAVAKLKNEILWSFSDCTLIRVVKRTAMGKRVGFFFAMHSTSVVWHHHLITIQWLFGLTRRMPIDVSTKSFTRILPSETWHIIIVYLMNIWVMSNHSTLDNIAFGCKDWILINP